MYTWNDTRKSLESRDSLWISDRLHQLHCKIPFLIDQAPLHHSPLGVRLADHPEERG